jgi:hypoxia up-regulated 1
MRFFHRFGAASSSSSLHLLWLWLYLSSLVLPSVRVVEARAILGVDLGSLYMKVALVQSGSPLEIVVNLHSKRKTEQMILFDRSQRFYGADAASLLARKASTTPAAMSLLLGRDEQHPVVQVRYY